MSLDDQSQRRKDRLALLKAAKRKREEGVLEDVAQASEVASSKMRYRNYDPETKDAKLGFLAAPVEEEEETVERRASRLAEQTKEEAAVSDQPIDIFNLQPKKPNWDLKRDLNRKLERLKGKQELMVAKLVRERILTLKAAGSTKAIDDIHGGRGDLARQVELLQKAQALQSVEETV